MDAIGEQSVQWFTAEKASAELDLTALVADYSTLLYRVALSVVRNSAEAEDVVQDVFVRVLKRQHALPSILEVRPWLIRIAWNLAIDRRRRIRPDQMDDKQPVVRHTTLKGEAALAPGKSLMLGSLDFPGSTRRIDVEALMEPLP